MGTKLLGISIGRGFGALKGLSSPELRRTSKKKNGEHACIVARVVRTVDGGDDDGDGDGDGDDIDGDD